MHRSDFCANCGAAAPGRFCSECGQKNTDYRESLRELLGELADQVLQLDSRIVRTIVPLFIRPGFLTREYNAGRRIRYSSPLAMYLVASAAYFFVISMTGLQVDFGPEGKTETRHKSALLHVQVTASTDRGTATTEKPAAQATLPKSSFDDRVDRKVQELAALGEKEASRRISGPFANHAPKVMFLLLPLFALLLKAFYRRMGRFYIEHLIFALHFHTFAFALMMAVKPFPRHVATLLAMGVVVLYLALALRAVYGQNWPRTALKLAGLGCSYGLLLGMALGAVLMAALVWS